MHLKGNNVLIVTPFNKNGEIDEKSLIQLLDYILEQKADGIIVLGTTGEFFSLTDAEKERVIRIAAERIQDQCALIVGVASPSAEMSAKIARVAGENGASAVLVPPPYYIHPTDEAMINHFSIIGAQGGVDLMVYDGGGGIEVPISVIKEVRHRTDTMKYIKLTTPKVNKVQEYHTALSGEVSVFAGEDLLIMPELYAGAVGLTTAAGNLQAAALSDIFRLVQEHRFEEAQKLHDQRIAPQAIVTGAIRNEFIQCFKTSLHLMGIIESDTVRNPLHALSEVRKENLKFMLRNQNLI
ncbi:dihydrodipicolinate synthase family protein [Paenibacillus athensensis]|nr:dihydrodipicolinate synthase family protein [Paenibacillus athensensis]MCD1259369.1 dihydrodipicolinate synthase family protein [Paenibacillus athensensis]